MNAPQAMRFLVALAATGLIATTARAQEGKAVYEVQCVGCHSTGVAGAPKRGNAADWAPRLKKGREALFRSAVKGTTTGMPPRGGNPGLSDAALKAAIDYLVGPVDGGGGGKAAEKVAAKAADRAAEKPAEKAVAVPAVAAAAPAPAPAVVPVAAPASTQQLPEPGSGTADSNAFNRLLKPVGKRNLPPMEDGIHDTTNDGTPQLQPPLTAFGAMQRSNAGNRVDWVKSLEQKKIAPRWERDKPEAQATVMDLNIVRQVKGSMPDVVYPHKQHTEWLDCSNCHPAIFIPQKGANQMSMAAILLGQGCGTCHGKVAFPVSECRLCHSRKKEATQLTQGGSPATQ